MSMTREKAIQWMQTEKASFERAPSLNGCPMTKDWQDAIDVYRLAIDALREQEERENPKPLTIEELRQMDGEPVWVVSDHYGTCCDVVQIYGAQWDEAYVGFKICYRLLGSDHGKTWIAYRHKPKEEV